MRQLWIFWVVAMAILIFPQSLYFEDYWVDESPAFYDGLFGDWYSNQWAYSSVEFGSYVLLINLCLFLVLVVWWNAHVSNVESLLLISSILGAAVCFLTNNVIIFWISYEVSILPLLIGLFLYSPYSERFIAGWYLFTYVLLTSLPMLVVLIYNCYISGSIYINVCSGNMGIVSTLVLFLLFITKVPLPPFHSWLPIVHAEASTFISVLLSGYVMKLGVIGVVRFCLSSLEQLFGYINVIFLLAFCFFGAAFYELDAKRWLAFLSLGHILVSLLSIYYCGLDSYTLGAVYCLGHGISAGYLFYYFLLCYNASGSRNWLVILQNSNGNVFWRVLLVAGIVSVCSFPPSLSFISEVLILTESLANKGAVYGFSLYLFLGGLIPAILLSLLIINTNSCYSSNSLMMSAVLVLAILFSLWLILSLCL